MNKDLTNVVGEQNKYVILMVMLFLDKQQRVRYFFSFNNNGGTAGLTMTRSMTL
jgi:hypothetical protein